MRTTEFQLDGWYVRPDLLRLERDGADVQVTPKAMAVLCVLADANGDVVTRSELFDAVWPGGVVSDDALTQCIVELRKAFGDDARDARVIETIPRRGFRLKQAPIGSDPPPTAPARAGRRRWPAATAGIGIALLAIAAAVGWLIRDTDSPAPAETISVIAERRIAVLRFIDLSANRDQQHLADGVAEEILTRLSQLQGLAVTGRTSSFSLDSRSADARTVGRELGVTHVLEGSVRQDGERLLITAQLVDTETGFQIWSDSYERPMDDVFSVQRDIAEAVADALSISLSVGLLGSTPGGTNNVQAFEELQLAKEQYSKFTPESMLAARQHLLRAIALDPRFAIGWATLSDLYRNSRLVFGDDQAAYWDDQADEAMQRAEELAPDSTFVLKAVAFRHIDKREWREADETLQRLADNDEGYDPRLSGIYFDLLIKTGRVSDAIPWMESAKRLHPLDPGVSMYLGHVYLLLGRFEEALEEFSHGAELEGSKAFLTAQGLVLALQLDDPELLRSWLERTRQYEQPGAEGAHTRMSELLDDPEAALAWLRAAYDNEEVPDYYIGLWAAYFDDYDLAWRATSRTPDLWSIWLPSFAPLRQRPEFVGLVVELGLDDYWRDVAWGDFCTPDAESTLRCR